MLTLISVDEQSVTLSYQPPATDDGSKIIKYRTNYRENDGGAWNSTSDTWNATSWNSTTDTTSTSQTITNLIANSTYEFTVVARYATTQHGPESDVLRVKTLGELYRPRNRGQKRA